jgi:chromosome segregation ATPase
MCMLATGRGELEAGIVDLTVEEREIVTHRDMMTSVTKDLKNQLQRERQVTERLREALRQLQLQLQALAEEAAALRAKLAESVPAERLRESEEAAARSAGRADAAEEALAAARAELGAAADDSRAARDEADRLRTGLADLQVLCARPRARRSRGGAG